MYAVFVEVSADESHTEEARKSLNETAVPMAKEHGGKTGFWLAPEGGRGLSVVVFDSEGDARRAAEPLHVGEPAGGVPGVTFKTVEVREVLASF